MADWRLMKSIEADLKVVVGGENEAKTFYYNSAILARYSDYIDTMLECPMQEKANKTIRFPDIKPATWERIIDLHKPGGTIHTTTDELMELLPYLDQYQFHLLYFVDEHLRLTIGSVLDGSAGFPRPYMRAITAICCQYQLPKAQVKAKHYARNFVRRNLLTFSDEEHLRSLLSIILHGDDDDDDDEKNEDDDTIAFMVRDVAGRNVEDRDAMRQVVREDANFPREYITKQLQISQVRDIARICKKEVVDVEDAGVTMANGSYRLKCEGPYIGEAMQRNYSRQVGMNTEYPTVSDAIVYPNVYEAIVKAADPFGKRWEIRLKHLQEQESSEGGIASTITATTLLYYWEEQFSSPIPPTVGWQVGTHGEAPAPTLSLRSR